MGRDLVAGVIPLVLFLTGCSTSVVGLNKLPANRAFIKHWPGDTDERMLRVAIKDNIDMKGVVTTAGSEIFDKTHKPAEQDATCLMNVRRDYVKIVGKTNLTEFAVAPSGFNEYFGTPVNPLKRRMIPGGSSSGNAVALAAGMADVAIGTDTAGSIRVPAACCGIVGLKTTFGLVSLKGIHPVEPRHLDTVGPMARNIEDTVKGMDLLQPGFAGKYNAEKAAWPSGHKIRVGRLKLKGTDRNIDEAIDEALAKAGFQVVQLGDDIAEKWDQAKADGNTVAAAGAWISDNKYQLALGVTARTKAVILTGQVTYTTAYRAALGRQAAWRRTLAGVFEKVDFIAVPTLQKSPPDLPLLNLRIGLLEALVLQLQNTVPVNFAGNPALAMPVPVKHEKVPMTSLQLIGPRLSEASLLNAGRLVEEAVRLGSRE
ncbi:MAG TPA: amidase [Chthoniobacterales bacterium]|nr:amidase [Chthoniobacterales bacterium]